MADLLLPDFPYFHKFTYVISYSILVHIAMTVIITSITNFISLFFRCVSLHHIRGSTIVIFTISIFHGIPSKLYLLAHSHFLIIYFYYHISFSLICSFLRLIVLIISKNFSITEFLALYMLIQNYLI